MTATRGVSRWCREETSSRPWTCNSPSGCKPIPPFPTPSGRARPRLFRAATLRLSARLRPPHARQVGPLVEPAHARPRRSHQRVAGVSAATIRFASVPRGAFGRPAAGRTVPLDLGRAAAPSRPDCGLPTRGRGGPPVRGESADPRGVARRRGLHRPGQDGVPAGDPAPHERPLGEARRRPIAPGAGAPSRALAPGRSRGRESRAGGRRRDPAGRSHGGALACPPARSLGPRRGGAVQCSAVQCRARAGCKRPSVHAPPGLQLLARVGLGAGSRVFQSGGRATRRPAPPCSSPPGRPRSRGGGGAGQPLGGARPRWAGGVAKRFPSCNCTTRTAPRSPFGPDPGRPQIGERLSVLSPSLGRSDRRCLPSSGPPGVAPGCSDLTLFCPLQRGAGSQNAEFSRLDPPCSCAHSSSLASLRAPRKDPPPLLAILGSDIVTLCKLDHFIGAGPLSTCVDLFRQFFCPVLKLEPGFLNCLQT